MLTDIIEEYRSKLSSQEQIFSNKDYEKLLYYLSISNDEFEASSIIEIMGSISWKLRTISEVFVEKVYQFLDNPNNSGFGSWSARSATEWVFGQWYSAGIDMVTKHKAKFYEILNGASWDVESESQIVLLSYLSNYHRKTRDKKIIEILNNLIEKNDSINPIKSISIEEVDLKKSVHDAAKKALMSLYVSD